MKKKKNSSNIIEYAKNIISIEIDSLRDLKDRINENFDDAVKEIIDCKGKIVITGIGKSGIIGKKIAATMCSLGTKAVFLHPVEALHGDSGIISKNDIVIAISNSGETKELLNLLPLFKKLNLKIIALTGNINSCLSKSSHIKLDISVKREADYLNLAPTSSCITTLALGDALAICVAKLKRFTINDFAFLHPSGKLGEICRKGGRKLSKT